MINDYQYYNSLLEYDKETGLFKWKQLRSNASKRDWFPGHHTKRGYRMVRIDGKPHMCHRLAWLLSTGQWPNIFIDHIDEDKSNNRLSNLRQADKSLNQLNQSKANIDSGTGLRGVTWDKQAEKFRAQLMVQGKKILNKLFTSAQDAANEYKRVKEVTLS